MLIFKSNFTEKIVKVGITIIVGIVFSKLFFYNKMHLCALPPDQIKLVYLKLKFLLYIFFFSVDSFMKTVVGKVVLIFSSVTVTCAFVILSAEMFLHLNQCSFWHSVNSWISLNRFDEMNHLKSVWLMFSFDLVEN